MKKNYLAVAVAGALALPGVAFAQSSVTITGFFKGGYESLSFSNTAKTPRSQHGVVDDSSRLIFQVREDLGGGLAAIGQWDFRPAVDSGSAAPANLAAGNNHVGLVSKSWGRIFFGRQDLHYFNRESELTVRGSLRADSISILSYVNAGGSGAGGSAIAGATRTPNVVHYTTPNWGGFTAIVAYSSNSGAQAEADIASGVRKGGAWNVNPNFAGRNFQVGYSYWASKVDANAAAGGRQRSDRLYGSMTFGGLKVGLAWDRSKMHNDTTGLDTTKRTAWSLPVQYEWGNHGVYGHYSKARDDKILGVNTGAKMWAVSYAYNLSKRTSAALTYSKINNDAAANYNFFTNAALGLGNAAVVAGEDLRLWALTLRHAF